MSKRKLSKEGFRTPDIFKRIVKHKIAKNKIYDKIAQYAKTDKNKKRPKY